jgi:predicted lactoylglutathione lyase
MTKEIWLNLPVRGLDKTKEFFSRLGFPLKEPHTNGEMVCFSVGESIGRTFTIIGG